MKRIVLVLLLSLIAPVALASSMWVDTGMSYQSGARIFWYGSAYYFNNAGQVGVGVGMSGNLVVYNDRNDLIYHIPWGTTSGSWEFHTTSDFDYNSCYYSAINAHTFDQFAQSYSGGMTCTPDPPFGGEDDPCDERPWLAECGPMCPLIVQTQHGAWSLTDPAGGVMFDMNADGRRDRTSWTTPGSGLAFVALDLNHNGTIDDAAELFGEHTRLSNGAKPPNGFVALDQYDDNGDDAIDAADAIWPFLVLWTDRNHDGVSQRAELEPIASTAVASLSTAYRWTGRRDQHGNLFRYAAACDAGNSAPYYDVYFQVKR